MHLGIIPAAYTAFNDDYSLNLRAIPEIAKLYKQQGQKTVFINGTTGEFTSLSLNERIVLAETWVEKTNDLSIWVHVGHTSQLDAIQLARHARNIGAKAISALAPFYFAPLSIPDLVEFLRPIAEASKELPFYYYHIPSMTHVHLNMELFIKEAIKRIPTFAGLKFSSSDLYMLQRAKTAATNSPCQILFGVDEMMLGALPFGIDGAIGSTYNFAAPLYKKLLSAFRQNQIQEAQALQSLSATLVSQLHAFGGISTGKAIMEMLGVSCGPPRPPLFPLTLEIKKNLYHKFSDLDIFPNLLHPPEEC